MEIVYLYCAFSYLWVLGAAVKSIGSKRDSVLSVVSCLLLSPVCMPIMIGADWYESR